MAKLDRRHAPKDYLWLAVALSALIHLLLIFWPTRAPSPTPANSLDVALVNFSTDSTPLSPQLLAQLNLDGGGEHQHGQASNPLPLTDPNLPNQLVLEALRARQQSLEAEQQRLLGELESQDKAPLSTPSFEYIGASIEPGPDDHDLDPQVQNSQLAILREQIREQQRQPRYHYVGPSAKASDQAQYLDQWRQKIEQTGTRHYPKQDGEQLYGQLQMTVYIRRDGSLLRAQITQPSDQATLNLAARRIVELAAPFAPLPEQVAPGADVLVITRTWSFTHDRLSMHSTDAQ
ncbi:energy transducer TonB [Alcaligenes faecalis]|uniref:energy transducer TonB family protein n=1 Tax=Alcaligenes faecalis TaxID=511 RepID=UPI0012934B10|nr:energy transducer TonB [Alcaligenes faecalis]MBX6965136.1 energy transducer TonB [Providencia rettgeri]MBX7031570.1 energy transducer TonB [Alcaligenes faecalis]QFY79097.1 energy transducer TonB [Alcaligenes faecalis]HCB1211972.1 energy transducer TonB [Klebsiella pneumoniae]